MNRLLPEYENPPINEVVLGVSFAPLHKMKVPHIGLFWDIVKKEFPRCEHAPIIGNIKDIVEPEAGVPIPRVWLINKEDDRLIQIQKNKFLLNWRKKEKHYPHFDDISKMFFEKLEIFWNFIKENDLDSMAVNEYELSYINHIPKGESWKDIASIGGLIPDITWHHTENRFLPDPAVINWQIIFSLPSGNGNLVVHLKTGFRKSDQHPLFILEMTARGLGEKGMFEWFRMAHEQIVLAFEDLTALEVQKNVMGENKSCVT